MQSCNSLLISQHIYLFMLLWYCILFIIVDSYNNLSFPELSGFIEYSWKTVELKFLSETLSYNLKNYIIFELMLK